MTHRRDVLHYFATPLRLTRLPSDTLLYRLSAGHLVVDSFAGFILPILPILSMKLGFGLAATGFILTVSSLMSSVLQPLWGVLTERFRRANYLLLGYVIAVLCLAFIGWSTHYWMLILLVALGYFGIGLLHPRAMTYAHSLGGRQENLVLSIFITAGASGFALGPLASSLLVDHWGLRATVCTLPLLVLGFVFFGNIDRSFLKTLAQSKKQTRKNPLTPTQWRWMALLSFVAIVRAMVMVGLDTFMPFVWTTFGYSLTMIGLVMGVASLIGIPLALYAGHLSDRIGERPIMYVSMIPCVFLLPAMLHASGWMSLALFIVLHALIQTSLTANTVLAYRLAPQSKNFVSGLIAGFSFGIAGLMMPLIGWMGEHTDILYAMNFLVVFMILGTVAMCCIPEHLYHPSRLPEAPRVSP